MLRVSILGLSCSGKTTLARTLAEQLGVPHIELDALHHDAGWNEAPAELLRERVRVALEGAPGGWVVDGNYYGKLGDFVLERADTAVLLELPLAVTLRRALWRTGSRLVLGTELWNGNRERLRDVLSRDSIPLWVMRNHRGFSSKWEERLHAHTQLDVVRLHSRREIAAWLQSIQASPVMSGSSNGSERQKTPPFTER